MSFLSALGNALKSRTVWVGIGTTVLGTGQLIAPYAPAILSLFPAGSAASAGITAALGVATIIGRMRAKQPLGPVIDKTIADSISAIQVIKGDQPATAHQVDSVTAIVKDQPGAINKHVAAAGKI